LVAMGNGPGSGTVAELSIAEKAIGWRIPNITFRGGGRMCSRLPNGRIVVYSRKGCEEYTSDGKAIGIPARADAEGLRPLDVYPVALRLSNREVCCVPLGSEKCLRVYARETGELLKTIQLQDAVDVNTQVESLWSGNLLLRDSRAGLTEVTRDGRTVWKMMQGGIVDATEGQRGATVFIATHGKVSVNRVAEINQKGEVLWEVLLSGTPYRIRPCHRLVRLGFRHWLPEGMNLDSTPSLVAALKSQNIYERRKAAKFLAAGEHRSAVPVGPLVERLADSDQGVRRDCQRILQVLSERAVPGLLEALGNPQRSVRIEAVTTLGQIRRMAKEVLP